MKKLIASTILMTGALVLATATTGAAQEVPEVGADIETPVLVCPIAVAIGGDVSSDCPPPAPTDPPTLEDIIRALFPFLVMPDAPSEVGAEIDAPVNVCPITIVVAGDIEGDCPTPAPTP